MTRFAGAVGYGDQQQIPPNSGIFKDVVVERTLYGDILRNTKQNRQGEYLNNDLVVSNSVSVVADAFAMANFFNIRYVKWQGVRWKVEDVEVQAPRLIMRLGGPYNGPTPA